MNKGDSIIVIRDSERPVNSTNTAMVAAFDLLGIKLDPDCAYLETREIVDGVERRQTTWAMKGKSEDGHYDTRKMIDAWHDPEFSLKNPCHPLVIMKRFFDNYRRLQGVIRGMPPCLVTRRGRRSVYIPADATPERREELLKGLEQ